MRRIMNSYFVYKLIRCPYKKADFMRKKGAQIGKNTRILDNVSFGSEPYLIKIGENVLISSDVRLVTHDGGISVLNNMGLINNGELFGRIEIGNNCFIGLRSIILRGVKIGDNCIIGAGSVVTKDIPDNSIVAGVPARVISTVNKWNSKIFNQVEYIDGNKIDYLKNKYL